MFLKRTVLCLALAAAVSVVGLAVAAPDSPDQRLLAMAQAGDAQAQLELGQAQLRAPNPVDRQAGLAWLTSAAAAGNASAHRALARYYLAQSSEGEAWPRAVAALSAAAALGDDDAALDLALARARRSLDTALPLETRRQLAAEALPVLQAPRQATNPDAQWHLGILYQQGLGTDADANAAFLAIQRAATRRQPAAAFWIAAQYLGDRKNTRTYEAGLHFLTVAAAEGHVGAMTELAHRLDVDQGRYANPERAQFWRAQAEQHRGTLSPVGGADAASSTTLVQLQGVAGELGGAIAIAPTVGTTAVPEAATPLTDALRAENTQLRQALADAHDRIRSLLADLAGARTEIAQLQRDLADTQARLAQAESAPAPTAPVDVDVDALAAASPDQDNAAGLAAVGEGDFEAAVVAFRRASERGHAAATANLALMYLNGTGVGADAKQCVRLLERAARRGSEQAAMNLGKLYQFGLGMPADPQAALAWYRRAEQLGNEQAPSLIAALAP